MDNYNIFSPLRGRSGGGLLIADSGSTKTDWALIKGKRFSTRGLNPVVMGEDLVERVLSEELLPNIPDTDAITEIHFFGAGCTKAKIPAVSEIFARLFPKATEIEVASDMLGAAKAVCRKGWGIAAILGTGSNSCLYDGEKIIQSTPCLGFILGDEGGGAVLGKHFLNGILKGTLPKALCDKFFHETSLTQDVILNKVYREEAPNRFLASMSPFIHDNLNFPELRELVVESFRLFFRNNIRQYDRQEKNVNFVGSMAFYYESELNEAAEKEGVKIGKLLKSPIEGLIEYYG